MQLPFLILAFALFILPAERTLAEQHPIITLVGESEMSVLQGQQFVDPGATAEDAEDGDLTDQIEIVGEVDTNTPGAYVLQYTVTDSDGNSASVEREVVVRSDSSPSITLLGENPMTIFEGAEFIDPGATAEDAEDGDLTDQIETTGEVDTNTPGAYVLQYAVTDSDGNSASVEREVVVRSDSPPSITLNGDNPMTIVEGAEFIDPGATAEDAEDGDLTDQIETTGEVDTSTPGEYVLQYSVTDSDGNAASVEREVVVRSDSSPSITLLGENPMTIFEGAEFVDPGATAEDAEDGDLTDQIETTGEVDTSTPGEYVLQYAVTDSDGNSASVEREVVVRSDSSPSITLNGDNPMTIVEGAQFVDPGATAEDAEDGDLSAQIEVEGTVDGATPGDYTLEYSVTDSDGNTVSTERLVIVAPNRPPVLTLLGSNPLTVSQGEPFEDPGARAEDAEDGDLTDSIEVTGEVDTGTAGEYPLTYTVTDSDGNTVSTERIVVVRNNPPELVRPIEAPNATEGMPYEEVNDGNGFSLDEFFTDPDGDTLYYEVSFGPWPQGLPESRRLRVDSDGTETGVRGLIYGTPEREDTSDEGARIVKVIVRDRADPTDPHVNEIEETFELTIEALGRADITLAIAASPDPAPIDSEVTWELTVGNASRSVTVQQVELEAELSGIPFTVLGAAGCQVNGRAFECTVGPIEAESSVTLELTGRPLEPGDLMLAGTATIPQITGLEPIDPNPNNNTAEKTLNVGRAFSAPAYTLPAPSSARGLTAGDIDGDGYLDLVLATGSGNPTRIYLSVPRFPDEPDSEALRVLSESPVLLDDDGNANAVLLVDLTNDGKLDLVVANGRLNETPQANEIFLNRGDEGEVGFELFQTLGNSASYAVAAADLTGNGFEDLVFANDGTNGIFINQGDGSFRAAGPLGEEDSRDVVIADFDGDALPDIVFVNQSGPALLYRNLGDSGQNGPSFADPIAITDTPKASVTAADFNGDGLPDLVFGRVVAESSAAPSNTIYINAGTPGSAAFVAASSRLGASPTPRIVTADLRGNGVADVIALNATGTHQIFRNAGNVAFTLQAEQLSSAAPAGASVGDFNNDGRADLAVSRNGGVEIFLNDGRGNLGPGDSTRPVIQLLGEPSVNVAVGSTYVDAGATANDEIDGDLTDRIVVDDPVETSVVGTYTVTYTVRDRSGNAATPVTRTVQVGAQEGASGGGGGSTSTLLLALLALLGLFRLRRTL